MDNGLPIAVVIGIDHFVAKKLCKALTDKELTVIGVGKDGDVENIEDVLEKSAYVFDFEQSVDGWKKAGKDGAKLTVINIDKEVDWRGIENNLNNFKIKVNWRMVEVKEVYGPEMDLENGWLGKCIKAAVLNRNMCLPKDKTVRPVEVDDVVEACLRACFLSGTNEERFVFGGAVIETDLVAKILKREAKMTKEAVGRDEERMAVEDNLIEDSWQKLRWVPVRSFEDSVGETLQYFFTIADEVGRKRPVKNNLTESKPFYAVVDEKKEEKVVLETKVVESFEPVAEEAEEEEIEEVVEEAEVEVERLPWVRPIGIKEETDEDNDNEEELIEEDEKIVEKVAVAEIPEKIIEKVVVEKKKKMGIGWGKISRIGVGMVFLILVGLGAWAGWLGWSVGNSAKTIVALLEKQEWQKAGEVTNNTLNKVRMVEKTLSGFGVGGEIDQGLRVIDEGLVVINKAIPAMKQGQLLYEVILKDKEADTAKTVAELGATLDGLTAEMGVLQARMGGRWSGAPGIWKIKMSQYGKLLDEWRETIQKGRMVLGVLPEFLGSDGTRREWLVLFQNEHELRPGGGFIGSFGILSFENGKLLNLEVRDVYSADGQLKGHVEPPTPIRDYLGEAGWFMRDSNWQASFPEASKDIVWFFEKETGRKIDGVIGINLAVAKGVLGVTGEVFLPDFKEKVNKDNLYEQAEFYSEQKFFPGSREKENFLGGLSKQLFEEIRGLSIQEQMGLMKTFFDLADRNEVQVAALESKTADVLAEMGWDGAMYDGGCVKTNCVADYLYVVEANLGVNKANYFVYRTIEQTVDISNASVARVVKINFNNTAKTNNWPGGDYKNYIRVYVPKEINISSVAVYDTDNAGNRTVLSDGEVTVKLVGNKKEIGFLVTIGITKRKTVELRYASNIDLNKENKFSYLGYIQRQSGYGNTGLVSLVSYPIDWQPLQVEPSASVVANKLLFNLKFDRDIRMGVEIGK